MKASAASSPDIVVFIVDDMDAGGYDALPKTQQLIGGTKFDNFIFNTPLCCPFRATLQTGLLAHNSGIKNNNHGGTIFPQLDHDTIATALHDVGYFTGYAGKYINQYTLHAPGWDVWSVDETDNNRYQEEGQYVTHWTTDKAIDIINQSPQDAPLFLMVGHFAPHAPWEPEPKYASSSIPNAINGKDRDRKRTLLSVDDSIEAIAVAMGNRWDTACVIFTSDNGFLIGQHNTEGKSHWWDSASRVPALIRGCGEEGASPETLLSSVDLTATILHTGRGIVHHDIDGRAIGPGITRDSVLIESWAESSAGYNRNPFDALKGDGWIYVSVRGGNEKYFLLSDGEEVDHWGTLEPDRRQSLRDTLAVKKSCQGAACG